MATTRLLDTLIPKPRKDYVAVYTPRDYVQVFPKARPMKATVREESRPMEHPLETGAIITDHRIILPVQVELSMLMYSGDYADTYKAIRQLFLDGTLLTVQTNSGVYENQLIQSMPHDESPDQYGTLTMALKLKQVIFVSARFGVVPRNPVNLTVTDRGQQQGTTPTVGTASAASGYYSGT